MGQLFTSLSQPKREQKMQLTHLEFNCPTDRFEPRFDISALSSFLRSFNGLQDFFVLSPVPQGKTKEFWSSVQHHSSTLQRVVYQQDTIQDSPSDPEPDLLWQLDSLTSVGISCTPQELLNSLERAPSRPKITFLHIRQTGLFNDESSPPKIPTEIESIFSGSFLSALEFAKWAFGPNGLPELRVLAFGDFAHGGRRPNIAWGRLDAMLESNETAQKGDLPFREITEKNIVLWELMQENRDFLEACPGDSLMPGRG